MLADEDITAEMLFADQPLEDVLEGKSPSQSTANVKAPAGVAQQAPTHDAPGSYTAQSFCCDRARRLHAGERALGGL